MPLSGTTMSVTNTYTPGAVITASGFNTNFTDFATTISTVLTTSMPFASGAVINFNSGDVTITHSANTLTFVGALSGGFIFEGPLKPSSTGADVALGSAASQWADAFLAEGGVINWDNGDVTITQTGNTLDLAGLDTLGLPEGAAINWDAGDVTLTQSGNSLTVAGGNLIFPGTATNDDAAAGQVGEYLSGTGSSVALTSNTAKTIASVSLTAGDWDVSGNILFAPAGTTTVSALTSSISTTNNTHSSIPGFGAAQLLQLAFATGSNQCLASGTRRLSIAGTTTVYLVGTAVFGVSTLTADAFIGARRVR